MAFKVFILLLILNNLSFISNTLKQEPNMHILRFGCLATDLLDFFRNSLFCVAMVTELVNDILQNIWLCATDCNKV